MKNPFGDMSNILKQAKAMQDQMAKNPATAIGFMQQMVPALAAQERKEAGELNALIKRSGGKFTVSPCKR